MTEYYRRIVREPGVYVHDGDAQNPIAKAILNNMGAG